MVLGGVFDQVDASLRICFAHGGGSFAFWLGRVEQAWRRRRRVGQRAARYVGRFNVDSAVFDASSCGCSSTRLAPSVAGRDHRTLGRRGGRARIQMRVPPPATSAPARRTRRPTWARGSCIAVWRRPVRGRRPLPRPTPPPSRR
jgi:hypothetical protein